MKTTLVIFLIAAVSIAIYFFVLGKLSQSDKATLLNQTRLSACPNKPNCLCSEYKTDVSHYISPIALNAANANQQFSILKKSIINMHGEIQHASNNYLSATFKSSIFGFVDDLEARLDTENNLIQLRSASRVGHSDFGANRKRIETLKLIYQESL
ncbi:MAG: DUF1499 domain-containing protein [Gammaproteobacteria bacterium]|nr:DUF1499 domain-containing protein [Gammaproteobacteria bacterium]